MRYFWRCLTAGSLLLLQFFPTDFALADPATPESERVAQFGDWWVVKKPATYVIADTGRRGRYTLCSAVHFSVDGWLEIEAKNDTAWSIYIADYEWRFPGELRKLKLRSGSEEIIFPSALYGGAMISAASRFMGRSEVVSMRALQSLIDEAAPVSIIDERGRQLAVFPNNGRDLREAFAKAIGCSLENAPK